MTAALAAPAEDPMSPPMAERLREGTWPLHGQAERSGIMPALLRGQLSQPQIAQLQRNLQALYAVLEPALRAHSASQPALAPWADAELARGPALVLDLVHLHGPGWPELPLTPAAQSYVVRLQTLAHDAPLLLAAHAYVRYLGDLSGGQMLARLVRKGLGWDMAQIDGTRFFDFGPADRVAQLAAGCRRALALLPAGQADALVGEAQWAFRQHALMFEQLVQTPGRSA